MSPPKKEAGGGQRPEFCDTKEFIKVEQLKKVR